MGMEQTVSFAAGATPAWPAVADLLARHNFPVSMRMIDGELAFPDEVPGEAWRELRLGTPPGMITVRRDAGRLLFVVWGNAEPSMRQAWNALVWAFAEAGNGHIETPEGALSPVEYRRSADLPAALQFGGEGS
jgi:hypothetical protein